ncbi:Zn-ribbon domain-containing OB-fold protein [Sphingomonas sp.]|uniref:Zn-ribbon domain-containing OB-fold protein n=1 Tax=Sphingomonas sp. TaxID=28214 RepID=UPI002DD6527E|nr:OB-fold domain-containing protein [Sphingomonas sp.]
MYNSGVAPALPFIALDSGHPRLAGVRCRTCDTRFAGGRLACARCGGRDFDAVTLAERGTVRQFTVVHRSFPGVRTPFVAAVVEMADGVAFQGTVEGVRPDPADIPFGLPVRIDYREVAGDAGQTFVSYVFVPDREAA